MQDLTPREAPELLPSERRYEIHAEALAYMAARGLAAGHRAVLAARPVVLTDLSHADPRRTETHDVHGLTKKTCIGENVKVGRMLLEVNLMNAISIPAHFDGEHILLDEPVELEPDTKLMVTILPKQDTEREVWLRLSGKRLENAYGDIEEEYSLDSIKEANPEYAGR